MSKIELLAPAKDYKTLTVAIQAGANAVYFAGKQFGARAFATNFTNDEIIEAVKYAHLRNVKVYVTVNTIVYENEFNELKTYVDFLYHANIDAIIVQDLGVINYIRRTFPDFEVHLSTQANVITTDSLQKYQELGIKRIVLARETPLELIKEMSKYGIELEVFIHGALCFAYSGNCLMSYAIGKRSGNRGTCAQPCRKKYQLLKNDLKCNDFSALLSMKDLCTLDRINELIEVGITSFKIEGRMKSPEYVFETVKAYREAIDRNLTNINGVLNNLKVTFNREFTKGYLFNEKNSRITNIKSVNHQGLLIGKITEQNQNSIFITLGHNLELGDAIRIVDKNEIGFIINKMFVNGIEVKEAKKGEIVKIPISLPNYRNKMIVKTQSGTLKNTVVNYLKDEHIKFPLKAHLKIFLNEFLELKLSSRNSEVIIKTIQLTEKANKPQNQEFYFDKLNKFNDTVFYLDEFILDTDNLTYLSIKDLNEIRRIATSLLEEDIINSFKRKNIPYDIKTNNFDRTPIEFEAIVNNQEQYNVCKEFGIKNIYTDFKSDQMNLCRVTNDHINNSLVHNLGQITNNSVVSNYLNIVNKEAIRLISSLGVNKVYLSVEAIDEIDKMNLNDINLDLGIIIYGRYDLMITKHCFIAKTHEYEEKHCGLCKNNSFAIKDEYGNIYPVLTDPKNGCILRILHFKPLDYLSQIDKFKKYGINKFLLVFTTEEKEEISYILNKISTIKRE